MVVNNMYIYFGWEMIAQIKYNVDRMLMLKTILKFMNCLFDLVSEAWAR